MSDPQTPFTNEDYFWLVVLFGIILLLWVFGHDGSLMPNIEETMP